MFETLALGELMRNHCGQPVERKTYRFSLRNVEAPFVVQSKCTKINKQMCSLSPGRQKLKKNKTSLKQKKMKIRFTDIYAYLRLFYGLSTETVNGTFFFYIRKWDNFASWFFRTKGEIHETFMLCMFSQSSGFDMFSTIYGIMCLSREFAVMGQLAFMPRSSCTHPSSCASAQGSAPSTTPSTAIDCSMQCSFQAGSTPRFAVTPCVYSYLDLSFSQFWTKT